ncbi:MAG: co-chaperone GroES [bacterium]|nr:co-chaperone GroES [bacterium]
MNSTAKIKIKPLAGYALIEPQEAEEVTASGIVLPDTAQEKPAQGKVVAVGNPIKRPEHEEKAEFEAGDTVLYKKWGGDEIKISGKEFKIVKFEDVMAILE